jgi:hypothetical protein
MSLPASQQRTLDLIEGELQASAAQLTSMFGIFTRLSSGDGPAVTERLRPSRLRAAAKDLPAFLLIPVAIVMVIVGIVFGGLGAGQGAGQGTGQGTGQGAGHRPPDRVIQLVVPGK